MKSIRKLVKNKNLTTKKRTTSKYACYAIGRIRRKTKAKQFNIREWRINEKINKHPGRLCGVDRVTEQSRRDDEYGPSRSARTHNERGRNQQE